MRTFRHIGTSPRVSDVSLAPLNVCANDDRCISVGLSVKVWTVMESGESHWLLGSLVGRSVSHVGSMQLGQWRPIARLGVESRPVFQINVTGMLF